MEMAQWNGYRASKAAGGGLYNGYVTPKAKQEWLVGSIVNVGFVRNLLVMDKVNGTYRLQSIANGKKYTFEPHMGLSAA